LNRNRENILASALKHSNLLDKSETLKRRKRSEAITMKHHFHPHKTLPRYFDGVRDEPEASMRSFPCLLSDDEKFINLEGK